MQRTITQTLRLAIGISFFAFILIGMNDGAVGVLLPGMQTTYHTGKDTISLLFFAGTVGYFIASFNNGLLLDKLGNRRFLLLAVLIMELGFALLSSRPPFLLLLLGIVPIGFGVAMLDAGLNSYIASLPDNTALLNYLHAFYGTGALLGPLVASSFLALGWVWNGVYFVWIGTAIFLFIGIGLAFPRREKTTHKEEQKAAGNVLLLTLRQRVVWLAALFLLVYVGTEVSLGSWSFSFLTQERHGPILFSGWIVSGYWVGLTLGRLLLGKLAQRIGNRRLIEVCLSGVVVGMVCLWAVPHLVAAAFALFLTGFSLGPIFPTTIALMSDALSSRILSSAIGFLASFGSMGGALLPWLAGNLAQQFGLWTLLPYVIVLTALMLVIWVIIQARPAHPAKPRELTACQQ
ncbi:MAG TPA: MFS transporter [Ktedonobacteraceae bacterium]|jgi:fucose permease|nr:MFS transporter [Ktedonobacteraceae bacterium]